MPVPDSTVHGLSERPPGRSGTWPHRFGVMALVALVAAGATGLLGPRTEEVSASAGGYELSVTYPATTRVGLPAPLHVFVSRKGGFDAPVQLALCDDWFDDLDFQSWYPTPSGEVGEDGTLVYEFDPPTGETLEVSLDAKTQPNSLGGRRSCSVQVLEDDAPVASAAFTTWTMP